MADLQVTICNRDAVPHILGIGENRTVLLLPGAKVEVAFLDLREIKLWRVTAEIIGGIPNG